MTSKFRPTASIDGNSLNWNSPPSTVDNGTFSDAKDEIDMIELMEQENDEKTEKEGVGYRNGFILIFILILFR